MDNPSERSTSKLRRGWVCALMLAAAGLLLIVGCKIEQRVQKNREFWSKFIDGIPDPNAPKVEIGRIRNGDRARPAIIVSVHRPFEQENCKACHKGESSDVRSLLSAAESSICMECHEPVVRKYPLMHGPVAAKACLWCHAPHNSEHPVLLRAAAPDLCMQCHDRQLLGNTPPEHLDPKVDCLSCHAAHGGEKRYFLKATPTTAPSTLPASTQPQTMATEVLP